MSGSTNAGDAFDLRTSRPAAESTYAGIVRLVEEAQRSKAPMSRLADRYSLLFLGVTVALAVAAWWFVMADTLREGTVGLLSGLRRLGVGRRGDKRLACVSKARSRHHGQRHDSDRACRPGVNARARRENTERSSGGEDKP